MLTALGAAFWLQLDGMSTAATTVGILALQTRGQAWAIYRMLGTLIGVVASFALAGLFPQSRELFLVGFAAWLGQCVYVGGLLDGSRTYGAVLCGYTVALVAVTQMNSPAARSLTSRPIFSFGGAKQSGIGTELDQEGLEAFTQVKIINMAK